MCGNHARCARYARHACAAAASTASTAAGTSTTLGRAWRTSALSLLVKVDLARPAPPRLLRLLLPPLVPPLVPLVPKERTCNRKRLARLLVRLLVLNRLLALRLNPPLLDTPLPRHDDQCPARDRCLPVSA